MVFSVKETTSGSFVFGLGYSQLAGLTTSIQLTQNNFLGTGNQVSLEAERNVYLQRYAFSFLNPVFHRRRHVAGIQPRLPRIRQLQLQHRVVFEHQQSAQVVLGLPITENDTVSALFGIDSNQINIFPGSTPQSIIDYIDALGKRTFHSWRTQLAWARDTRNDYFTPTRGTYQRVSAEITLPGSTVAVLQAQLRLLEVLAAVARRWCSTPASSLATATAMAAR